jgi:hypothetical protein
MATNYIAKQTFVSLLVDIERSAKAARKNLDPSLLVRKRKQNKPELYQFVWLTAEIWQSLTGRRASAQKVTSKSQEDPDFVLLVRELAQIAQAPLALRREIETTLRNLRRPTD